MSRVAGRGCVACVQEPLWCSPLVLAAPATHVRLLPTVQHETLYLGERRIRIRTSVLEEKATACNMLCCYADELKEGFFPYVEEVCQTGAAAFRGADVCREHRQQHSESNAGRPEQVAP